jgi:hypothetical protein
MTGCASMGGSAGVDWAAMNPGAVPDYNEANSQAKDAIRHFLKDPDSAQFRSTTPFFKTLYNFGFGAAGSYEPLWAMCIEVNAKNSYGGYTGYQNWLVKFRNGQAVRDELGVMRADYDCQNGPSQVARVAG